MNSNKNKLVFLIFAKHTLIMTHLPPFVFTKKHDRDLTPNNYEEDFL